MEKNTKVLVAAQLAAAVIECGRYGHASEAKAAKVFYNVLKELDEQKPDGDSFLNHLPG